MQNFTEPTPAEFKAAMAKAKTPYMVEAVLWHHYSETLHILENGSESDKEMVRKARLSWVYEEVQHEYRETGRPLTIKRLRELVRRFSEEAD